MAIKGAVLGDILGSQYEFNRPKNLDWQNIPLIIDDKAKFTDDSVMMLAIKKALVEDNDLVETMVDVGQQYPLCGYGAKFFSWINGKNHQPYNSWGNGSAMRVAFVGDFYEDYDEMLKNGKPFGKDYFDELLERIREIRASERRAYQKITDIFEQCSYPLLRLTSRTPIRSS